MRQLLLMPDRTQKPYDIGVKKQKGRSLSYGAQARLAAAGKVERVTLVRHEDKSVRYLQRICCRPLSGRWSGWQETKPRQKSVVLKYNE